MGKSQPNGQNIVSGRYLHKDVSHVTDYCKVANDFTSSALSDFVQKGFQRQIDAPGGGCLNLMVGVAKMKVTQNDPKTPFMNIRSHDLPLYGFCNDFSFWGYKIPTILDQSGTRILDTLGGEVDLW